MVWMIFEWLTTTANSILNLRVDFCQTWSKPINANSLLFVDIIVSEHKSQLPHSRVSPFILDTVIRRARYVDQVTLGGTLRFRQRRPQFLLLASRHHPCRKEWQWRCQVHWYYELPICHEVISSLSSKCIRNLSLNKNYQPIFTCLQPNFYGHEKYDWYLFNTMRSGKI